MVLSISELNNKQRSAILICLISLCLLTFLVALTQWIADWQLAHKKAPHTTTANNTSEDTLLTDLATAHLFGQAYNDNGDVPITNLQLKVTATMEAIDSTGANKGSAMIAISNEPSKRYLVGDVLPDGVKIYRIDHSTVVLENNGRLEKLPLAREALQFKPSIREES